MYILGFVVGALLGSVANAVIYRLPLGLSWVNGRSMCPTCNHVLQAKDLLPLVSYLLLGGRCRYCKQAIKPRYFFVELLLAVVGAWLFRSGSVDVSTVVLLVLVWVTTVIAITDWETKLVSDIFVITWAILAFVWSVLSGNWSVMPHMVGVAASVGLIGGIWLFSRGKGMGFGDVEIAVAMGIWLGWPRVAYALWLAFVSGAVWGVLLLLRKKGKLQTEVPFGPFLVLGSWLAWLVPVGTLFAMIGL